MIKDSDHNSTPCVSAVTYLPVTYISCVRKRIKMHNMTEKMSYFK